MPLWLEIGGVVALAVLGIALLVWRHVHGATRVPVGADGRAPCPTCKESVVAGARVCPHCRQAILSLEPQTDTLLKAIVPLLVLGIGAYYAVSRGWFF